MQAPRTLFEKIWSRHVVADLGEGFALLHVDRHVVADFNGNAFTRMAERGLEVCNPKFTFATADHSVSTDPRDLDPLQLKNPHVIALCKDTRRFGVKLFDLGQPGLTVAIRDSQTCTNGAPGALAWGQGEVVHILATQTYVQRKPSTTRVMLDGPLPPGASGKDLILHLIGTLGVDAGNGYAVEYAGSAIRALPTDEGAAFDTEVRIDVSALRPQVTWGNSLDAVLPVDGRIPDPTGEPDAAKRAVMQEALRYMDLQPGRSIAGTPIDRVFIGSCTNSRITDLRAATAVVRGHKVAPRVRTWVVPGSEQVKREAEGLDRIFSEAGFEWRSPGFSMCLGGNGDVIGSGERAVSTANRNFAGRQGPGSCTHIASPALAAASACLGHIADPRELAEGTSP
ncbi:MAG: aconitase family protein [Candidatus Protistobacter heckmanni]|nr:aconitase family protein [Candidatus Protistobacter heckmanni]